MASGKSYSAWRAFGLGQLMLVSSALSAANQLAGTAPAEATAAVQSPDAASAPNDDSTRAVLLYLGEFAPELDPIEVNALAETENEMAEMKANADASRHPND